MDTTPHDLKLLSIGYYIQGGIMVASALLCLVYFAFVSAIVASDDRSRMPATMLWVIGGMIMGMMLLGLVSGAFMFWAGRSLRRHTNRILILIMATLNCLAMPYGTVLGIFTFMVLQRPAAKQLFGEPIAPADQPVPQAL